MSGARDRGPLADGHRRARDDPRGAGARVEAPTLEAVMPCVHADARAGRFAIWGWSTIIDSTVNEPIIGRELFARLHDEAGIEADFPVGNAGLLHVYGYLFSTLMTPYGRKRDRWNDGALATKLGYRDDEFRFDSSVETTPLQRVSHAAMPLLLVPPEGSLVVDQPVLGADSRVVVTSPDAHGAGALCYGVAEDADGLRLVTMFPVADARSFASEVTDFSRGPEATNVLRWNAALTPSPRAARMR